MAVREPSTGKGRYDLITPYGTRRLAEWYELGAQKYTRGYSVERDDILSVIKRNVEMSTNAPSAVYINYIAKECVEAVTKSHCEQEIQNTFCASEKTQIDGVRNIRNGFTTQTADAEKIPIAVKEMQEHNDFLRLEELGLQKKNIINYWNGNKINALSAEELLKALEPYMLTMITKQGMQEESYAVGATTELECLRNLLTLCKKLFPTFSILRLDSSSIQNHYDITISGDRNWERGMPFSRYIDSAKRHLDKFVMGMEDEDHLAAAAWNIFAIMHHQELGQDELDDMPHYERGLHE